MDNITKLEEITQKLYNEGLSKGKEEGEKLLSLAKEEAESCLNKAKKEAEELKKRTEIECEQQKQNTEAELKRTIRQMLIGLKSDMEENLLKESVNPLVNSAFESKDFVQKMIIEAIKSLSKEDVHGEEWEVMWPENMRNEWDQLLKSDIDTKIQAGLKVNFTRDIEHGFQLQKKEKGYKLSFTEDDFRALFKAYAREKFQKWLFETE